MKTETDIQENNVAKLSDGHGFSHLSLASNSTFTRCRCTSSWLAFKDLPEFQAFVRCRGGQELTIRTQAAVQNTGLVCRDLNVADQSGVTPDAQRVIGESTGANNLPVVVAPPQAGDLRAGIDAVGTGTRRGVPEVNMAIV